MVALDNSSHADLACDGAWNTSNAVPHQVFPGFEVVLSVLAKEGHTEKCPYTPSTSFLLQCEQPPW